MAVLNLAGIFIEEQQPGRVSSLERCLSDQLLRKVKIKIGFLHGKHFSVWICSCFVIISKAFLIFNRARS